MIKAIETVYKGYRFRSRLEARWAVFFDALGIEWEYEPEGFELGEVGRYLPDFRLTKHGCYIEIKPPSAWVDICNGALNTQLTVFSSSAPIIAFAGLPTIEQFNGRLFCNDLSDSGGGSYRNDVTWAWCFLCQAPVLKVYKDRRLGNGDRTLYVDSCMSEPFYFNCFPKHGHLSWHWKDGYSHPLEKACIQAKQARFEHGQVGAPSDWAR